MMTAITTMPTVLELPAERIGELARLGEEFFAEGKLPGHFKPEVFARTWAGLITSGAGALLALEVDGRLIGGLGAIVYPDPNDGALVATEMFWFVQREQRGHGLMLLAVFERWARAKGARRLAMVHLTTLMPAVLERVYKARGFRHVESHYLKEI